jgi:hypothetical protein
MLFGPEEDETRVPSGPKTWPWVARAAVISLGQEEVALRVSRLRAQVQSSHGGDAGQRAIRPLATGEYPLNDLRHSRLLSA